MVPVFLNLLRTKHICLTNKFLIWFHLISVIKFIQMLDLSFFVSNIIVQGSLYLVGGMIDSYWSPVHPSDLIVCLFEFLSRLIKLLFFCLKTHLTQLLVNICIIGKLTLIKRLKMTKITWCSSEIYNPTYSYS